MTPEQAAALRAPETTREGLPRQRLRGAPLIERLMFRTEVKADGCWLWKGNTNHKGYGGIRRENGSWVSVHRASYECLVGHIPEGLEIDHLCGVRNCVNPAHLEPVDRITNVNRGRRNQNHGKSHCARGHEFSPSNTYAHFRHGRQRRTCRACSKERMRLYREGRRQ